MTGEPNNYTRATASYGKHELFTTSVPCFRVLKFQMITDNKPDKECWSFDRQVTCIVDNKSKPSIL